MAQSQITEFNNIFDRLYRFQTNNEDIKTAGLKIIYDPGYTMAVKIETTYKMLVIQPKDVYLHYVMGCMYKDTQRFDALAWFKKCYELEPLFIENLIDMLKILVIFLMILLIKISIIILINIYIFIILKIRNSMTFYFLMKLFLILILKLNLYLVIN